MNNLIMKCLFGSHLYQLQTPNSDKDYKGVYLPEKDNLLLGNYAKHYSQSTGDDKSKNTSEDIDVEIFSLPYFIELACKGETVAIDMLHAKALRYPHDKEYYTINHCLLNIWNDLKDNRTKFYTKDMKSYVGYARKQANKYGVKGSRMGDVEKVVNWLKFSKNEEQRFTTTIRQVYTQLPTSEFIKLVSQDTKQGELKFYEICGRKYQDTLTLEQLLVHAQGIYDEYGDRAKMAKLDLGVDFKAVSHSIRASYQMLHILEDGDFEYPLPETDFILAVKKGELNFVNDIQPVLEGLIEKIEKLAAVSALPQKVDRGYWDKWLLGVYEEYL